MKLPIAKRFCAMVLGAVVLSAGSLAATLGDNCQGSNVPPPCVETTTSLGMFIINIATPFRAGFAGDPRYNPTTHDFLSPLLFDPTTMINRSAPFLDGSASDVGDPAVLPSDFTQLPGHDEVHTSINNFALTGGGFSVNAGSSSDRPPSPGEVESTNGGPYPANDFPARSFFDVFVDITIPTPGGPAIAVNGLNGNAGDTSEPLVVENNGITSLPPTVVYTHGTSTSVPLYFENNSANTTLGIAGDLLGNLMLTGHGAGYTEQGSTGAVGNNGPVNFQHQFNNLIKTYDSQDEAFFAPLITPEPSTWMLLMLGSGLAGLTRLRRRS